MWYYLKRQDAFSFLVMDEGWALETKGINHRIACLLIMEKPEKCMKTQAQSHMFTKMLQFLTENQNNNYIQWNYLIT